MGKTILGILWVLLFNILQCFSSRGINIIAPSQDEQRTDFVAKIMTFIQRVQQEKPFETFVVFIDATAEKEHLLMSELWAQLRQRIFVPLVLINPATSYEFRKEFNSEIFLLRCLSIDSDQELFQEFTPFPVITNFRVLLVFDEDLRTPAAAGKMEHYCRNMHIHQVINMVAISGDLLTSDSYLRCRSLTGNEGVEAKLLNESLELYEDRIRDLQGQEILTLDDLLAPRTMREVDKQGKHQLIGYVGLLLKEFVEKHNAVLRSIRDPDDDTTIFYGVIVNKTLAGELDVGATLVPAEPHASHVTYPYEMSSACYMIPLPAYLRADEVYLSIIKPNIWLLLLPLAVIFSTLLAYHAHGERWQFGVWDVLLNDRTYRGLLGQSFPMPLRPTVRLKYVLMMVGFTSLMTNTMYQAFLQTMLTQPPRHDRIRSYADIAASGKKIMIPADEFNSVKSYLGPDAFAYDVFEVRQDYDHVLRIRETLNTDYIFPVSYQRWEVFEEQQRLFSEKLFFYSDDMCLVPTAALCLPITKNSRYRDALNRVILQLRDSGLQQLWMAWSFYEMVRLNLTSLEDLSERQFYGDGEQTVAELFWLWVMYFVGIVLSVLMFLWEKFNWWWKSRASKKNNRAWKCKKYFKSK